MHNKNEWQPTAPLPHLKKRAYLLQQIRQFFAERDILEVETPIVGQATVTDPHLHSISVHYHAQSQANSIGYLQTSPEYYMKRLLAAGSGSIYQICKAFRNDEVGKQHNPEFSLLEWYRVDYDYQQLMQEVYELLKTVLPVSQQQRYCYASLFETYCGINPHATDLDELNACCEKHNVGVPIGMTQPTRDDLLQWLLAEVIEPQFDPSVATFVYDFPVSQALLARIRDDKPPVAERFEAYIGGMELANGFHELNDADEQLKRFEYDNQIRQQHGLPIIAYDQRFIAALKVGLPQCAGVAVGFDRLLMLATQAESIRDVVSFAHPHL